MDNLKYAFRYRYRTDKSKVGSILVGSIRVPKPDGNGRFTIGVYYVKGSLSHTYFTYSQYCYFQDYNYFRGYNIRQLSDKYVLQHLNSMLNRRYWEI